MMLTVQCREKATCIYFQKSVLITSWRWLSKNITLLKCSRKCHNFLYFLCYLFDFIKSIWQFEGPRSVVSPLSFTFKQPHYQIWSHYLNFLKTLVWISTCGGTYHPEFLLLGGYPKTGLPLRCTAASNLSPFST